MASHFFLVVVAAIKVAVAVATEAVVNYTLLMTAHCCLILQGYTSPMASLTFLTVIKVKDLFPT
jgi:hypothetical protein